MTNKELSPLQQAEHELIDSSRYGTMITNHRLHRIIFSCVAIASLYIYLEHVDNNSLAIHFAGATIYLLATVADHLSTIKALNEFNQAKENEIETSYQESNFLARDSKTAHHLNRNLKAYLGDSAGVIISGILPPAGIAGACLRTMCALNNLQITKVHHRAIEIKHQQETSD